MSVHPGHLQHDLFYFSVFPFGIIILFEAAAKDPGNGLPELRGKATLVFLHQLVTGIAGFSVDEVEEVEGVEGVEEVEG